MTNTIALSSGMLIGDRWLTSGERQMEHVNPTSGQVQAEFPVASDEVVDEAVTSARDGQRRWAAFAPEQRAAALHRVADQLRQRADELTAICIEETGLPAGVAAFHAPHAARWFDYYAGWADRIHGKTITIPGSMDLTIAEPFGVVACVTTWNGPIVGTAMGAAAPLAAGCAVVLKPPELGPFSSRLLGEVFLAAGLPPGTVNIVLGDGGVGDALVRHPGIDKITFTGGPETAARIQASCAASLTPLVLELGGKSANIVLADADLEAAAQHAAANILIMTGQVCVAPTRLLIQRPVYASVVQRVGEIMAAAQIGDPHDPTTQVGPVISQRAQERIRSVISDAERSSDGEIVAGGADAVPGLGNGFYVRPTLFGNVEPSSDLAQDEVFGPVLTATPFDDPDEAVEIANSTRYGLAAYLHTRDVTRALTIAGQLDAGSISINGGSSESGPYAPFGGFKDSGYGKQGGEEGLLEFVRIKNVNIRLG
jgi:aldehyde dehydrogenase (NAD+)